MYKRSVAVHEWARSLRHTPQQSEFNIVGDMNEFQEPEVRPRSLVSRF